MRLGRLRGWRSTRLLRRGIKWNFCGGGGRTWMGNLDTRQFG